MTAPVLMDHVSAYAAAVRSHLADLSPEQIEDLTDGLEADLAEALEDPRGPVATGEIPIGRPGGSLAADGAGSAIIDLTQRFGPAADYAAELRSAAGVEPAAPTARQRPVRDRVAGLGAAVVTRTLDATVPLRSSGFWKGGVAFVVSVRPLWWVLRGWVLYTVTRIAFVNWTMGYSVDQEFVPRTEATWLVLGAFVLASIQIGRGLGRKRAWSRRMLAVLNLVAVALLIPTLASFDEAVRLRLAEARAYPVYIERQGVGSATPTNGVFVDGMQVSNLFVYDAEGNPLTQVQVFDDRGRPVRTTYDGGQQPWSLPGVAEPWTFVPSQDEDGRNRWNVYPLSGLPATQMEYTDLSPLPQPIGDATPRTPPRPFAKAPAVVAATGPSAPAPDPTSAATAAP